nr:MAG TPA: hypothetical protein [Caudoviricetes sp.]
MFVTVCYNSLQSVKSQIEMVRIEGLYSILLTITTLSKAYISKRGK